MKLISALLDGEVDFNVIDGLGMSLKVELTLVFMNVKGLKGGGGREGERTYGFTGFSQ